MGVFRNFPKKKPDKEKEVSLFEENKEVDLGPMLDLLLLDAELEEDKGVNYGRTRIRKKTGWWQK